MGYSIFRADDRDWSAPSAGDQTRGIVRLSDAMTQMRANIWRMPPGSRGRRHTERVQEEIFVVLSGTATLALGDPADRVELAQGSVAVVDAGTPIQVLNEGDGETTVLILGAPPVGGEADYLPDALAGRTPVRQLLVRGVRILPGAQRKPHYGGFSVGGEVPNSVVCVRMDVHTPTLERVLKLGSQTPNGPRVREGGAALGGEERRAAPLFETLERRGSDRVTALARKRCRLAA
jgi:mannose-6-phosphate isomerase-like protein (cupin superfamily)